jgi:hypothetical protein
MRLVTNTNKWSRFRAMRLCSRQPGWPIGAAANRRFSRRRKSAARRFSASSSSLSRCLPIATARNSNHLNGALHPMSPDSMAYRASRNKCARQTCHSWPWPRWQVRLFPLRRRTRGIIRSFGRLLVFRQPPLKCGDTRQGRFQLANQRQQLADQRIFRRVTQPAEVDIGGHTTFGSSRPCARQPQSPSTRAAGSNAPFWSLGDTGVSNDKSFLFLFFKKEHSSSCCSAGAAVEPCPLPVLSLQSVFGVGAPHPPCRPRFHLTAT